LEASTPYFDREDETLVLADGRVFGLARYGAADGLPVLALHGAPASRYMFDVADQPARELGLTLYCPDRPGYGLTPEDAGATLGERVDELAAIADTLRFDRFIVLGISGGGPYATGLAAKLGERVTALGLVSPMGPIGELAAEFQPPAEVRDAVHRGHKLFFTSLPKRPRLLRAKASLSAAAFGAAPKAFAAVFRRMLSSADGAVLSQTHVEASLIRMTQEALRQGPSGGLSDMAIFSQPWNVPFDAVVSKAHLWQGTADRIVPAPVSFWLASRIRECKVTRLEGAGHFWVYGHAGEVLARLKTMHRSVAGAGAA